MQLVVCISISIFAILVLPLNVLAMGNNSKKIHRIQSGYKNIDYSNKLGELGENSKEADIKKLVKLIDPAEQEVELLKELFRNLTKVDKSEWDRLLGEIDFDVVSALYYPTYDKYFTHDEIKELIVFYLSEPGVKMSRSKSDLFGMQNFTQEELDIIEDFSRTKIGKKYDKLLNKINRKHAKLAGKYIDSLK